MLTLQARRSSSNTALHSLCDGHPMIKSATEIRIFMILLVICSNNAGVIYNNRNRITNFKEVIHWNIVLELNKWVAFHNVAINHIRFSVLQFYSMLLPVACQKLLFLIQIDFVFLEVAH